MQEYVRLDTVPDFANLIRERRIQAGLTRRHLARRAGLSLSSLARFERSETPNLPLERVLRLFRALGIHLEVAPACRAPTLLEVLADVRVGRNTGPRSR